MAGNYGKVVHLGSENQAVAEELAHRVCEATIARINERFSEGAGYRTFIDGKPNGDLDAKVIRGALAGQITSIVGHDMIYEDGRPTKKMMLRFNAEYENTAMEKANKLRDDMTYYAKWFTGLGLGTILAIIANIAVLIAMSGLTNVYIVVALIFVSYAVAAAIGAFFGEKIGDLYVKLKGGQMERDQNFNQSEIDWCGFVDDLQQEVEALMNAAQSVGNR